jgi:hypothetical protein
MYVLGAGMAAGVGFGIYEIFQTSQSGNNPAVKPASP